jgi:hypothetical protein
VRKLGSRIALTGLLQDQDGARFGSFLDPIPEVRNHPAALARKSRRVWSFNARAEVEGVDGSRVHRPLGGREADGILTAGLAR